MKKGNRRGMKNKILQWGCDTHTHTYIYIYIQAYDRARAPPPPDDAVSCLALSFRPLSGHTAQGKSEREEQAN